ncbi:fimbrial biogenesis chaperone [Yersinia enterocolitica]|uniref:fimbrial biogenesis chaperone n=1 Tax=Yersinia enterocolitica TaxID=630 RepID=UPI0009785439|nr:molecular chaperone [Yersinia enterocolitica]ELI7921276.1 molecular chaperone [Yersinia enterocolitica]HEN3580538.1 molecular chaperone [Yersinia enterocolitica]HEN3613777.1 molecular chaperone [Yersinia enterocolitica]HEN3639319.1 molecular chaperone [Yersinia enterocolitica]HEN3647596.1 molecular chaperone [Yersinia enterocolitica]
MKFMLATLAAVLLLQAGTTQAGVIIGGTRLIYDGGKKESSLSVNNPDKSPYLIQSWVEPLDGGTEKAPFMITPPLFRIDGGQENRLRVVRTGGHLPEDRESMFWMDIKAIPSATKESGQNTLQIAVKNRLKLIYRPSGLKGSPEDRTEELKWQRSDNQLQVTNPTPFYMNFQSITVGGKDVKEITYVAPMSSTSFPCPEASRGNVVWKIITDFGAIGQPHTSTF